MLEIILAIIAIAAIAFFIGAIAAVFISERRRQCPVCGKRGFVTILIHGVDDGDGSEPEYSILHCSACGTREVESVNGVRRLPAEGWEEAAEQYAREMMR